MGPVVQSDGASCITQARDRSCLSELLSVDAPVITDGKQGVIYGPGIDEHGPGCGDFDSEVEEVEVVVLSLVGEMSLVSLACKSEVSTEGTSCAVGVDWALETGY